MEPCHTPELKEIPLERLRHTALVITKVLAVGVCLEALGKPRPPDWVDRIPRDLVDIQYLTNRAFAKTLWCATCESKRRVLHERLGPTMSLLQESRLSPPSGLSPESRELLREVVDGFPFWWVHA